MTIIDQDMTDAVLAARLARLEELLGVPPPPEVDLLASAMPPTVAAGQLITSAWGNQVVGRLTDHVTHATVAKAVGAGTATSLSPGAGPLVIPSAGLWIVSATVDLNGTGGYGFLDLWLSYVAAPDRIGHTLIDPRHFESTIRSNVTGLWALYVPGGGDVFLRLNTFTASVGYSGLLISAWQLYAGGPS